MQKKSLVILVILALGYGPHSGVFSQEQLPEGLPQPEAATAMTVERLQEIIQKIDPEFTGRPGLWQLRVGQVSVRVITDRNADRMRIIVPIRKTEELTAEEMYRILQANYDSALDARYAVGQDILWGAFVHPLSSLTDKDFISGLGQTVNVALTYGKTYSSGVFTFGGGDSGEIIERQLIDELMKKGEVI